MVVIRNISKGFVMGKINRILSSLVIILLMACSRAPAQPAVSGPTATPPGSTAATLNTASPFPPESPTIEISPTAEDAGAATDTPAAGQENQPGEKNLLVASSPVFPYEIQANSPVYMPNFAHPEKACSWMGVAGQAFDHTNRPVINLVVEVGGTLNGTPVDLLGMTGTTKVYGPYGYEITLSNNVLNSMGTLWIHLLNLSGTPLTDQVSFDTHADCTKNLILINFKELGTNRLYFPFVGVGGQ